MSVFTILSACVGGGMFRRGDIYYVMLSFDCCCEWSHTTDNKVIIAEHVIYVLSCATVCQWGSDALVFVAPSPLGPWAPQTDSNLAAIHRLSTFMGSLLVLAVVNVGSLCHFGPN